MYQHNEMNARVVRLIWSFQPNETNMYRKINDEPGTPAISIDATHTHSHHTRCTFVWLSGAMHTLNYQPPIWLVYYVDNIPFHKAAVLYNFEKKDKDKKTATNERTKWIKKIILKIWFRQGFRCGCQLKI